MLPLQCYLGVYFPCCCATQEININLTLLWAHEQFPTCVHTLLYINNQICAARPNDHDGREAMFTNANYQWDPANSAIAHGNCNVTTACPETSVILWIHRETLTNQRCSLATGRGITLLIPHLVPGEHRWLVKALLWIHSVPDVSSRRSWCCICCAHLWNLHNITNTPCL